MSNETINAELLKLTDGLLYISESDYEVDVQDWGVQDAESVLNKISEVSNMAVAGIEGQNADTFFNRTIKAFDPSDDYAAELAEQFKKLYAYLKATFDTISVYRVGDVNVHIFVTCLTGQGHCFALHTISVET